MSRQTRVDISIAGVNVTKSLEQDLISLTYTDNSGEEEAEGIDDLTITLQNRSKKWMHQWLPVKGDTLAGKIITEDWTGSLDLGSFTIDTVGFSGPPNLVEIKALAFPMNVGFSDVKRSRTWNKATIEKVVRTIGTYNHLPVEYRALYNPRLSFVSQKKESDKTFLYRFCKKYGLAVKLFSNRIVIYDMSVLEKQKASFTLQPFHLLDFNCEDTIANTGYTSCKVKYTDQSGKTLTYDYNPTGEENGKAFTYQTKVGSLEEAKRVAQAKLREKNKPQTTFSCTIPGDTHKLTGMTGLILGFGHFNGRYMIDTATHTIGDGYTTALEMHKVVEHANSNSDTGGL